MEHGQLNWIANFIWGVADDVLRDLYVRGNSLTRRGMAAGLRPEQLPMLDRIPETAFDKLSMLYRFKVRHRDRSVRLVTEGLGEQPFHGRIVMLVNEHTASAAEMVAGFASERRLATLVGIRTAGQVLGGANFAVGQNFTLRLPAAAWHMWNGETLEGRGVTPDLTVPLDPHSLTRGTDNQLRAAVERLGNLTAYVERMDTAPSFADSASAST